MYLLKRTWADVSLDHLAYNYQQIRNHVPSGTGFLGVVKADAYGHGAVPVSRALVELGAEYLAVSNLDEAMQLRRSGVEAPILILGYTPPMFACEMAAQSILQEVHSLEYALQLQETLKGTRQVLRIHLKLDTGMNRIGFQTDSATVQEELLEVLQLPNLHMEGVFTHFSVADSRASADEIYTQEQFRRFCSITEYLTACGHRPALRHCCNSGATLLHPEYALDMIRPGILTYGIAPSADTADILSMKPLMSIYTTVSQIKDTPAGAAVSYGRTFLADRDSRLAVLSIGYADGLSRQLSGRVSFLLHGKPAPVVGRICMDLCIVDVTDIPAVQVGDVATVIGTEKPCEYLAGLLDTIPYEILSGFSKRIPRIYLQDGQAKEILQYIV